MDDCSASAVNDLNQGVEMDCSQENVFGPENIESALKERTEVKKRGRSLKSSVWNYFNKVNVGSDGQEKSQCKACGKEYISGGNKYGTSTLQRHLTKCEKVPKFHNTEIGKLMLDHVGKLRGRKIDHKIVRDLISMVIIEHDLPFSFVEYRRVRELLQYLNPEVKNYSRRVVTSDVINMYENEKTKLKKMLAIIPSRICLTSDVWTSCTTEGYISLTAHFVDENWKLNSKILNFCHFPPPHSGPELAKIVFGFLEEWGIEKKIFSLTLDNASSNDNMQELLKERLLMQNNGLLSGGEFFHIRCCAHILNLIVQEGLKVTSTALHKIRESIKYVKGSEGRMNAFKSCVAQIGGVNTKVGLRLDVTTRWNSTFMMLESALAYRRAFSNLAFNDRSYKNCPTSEEWTRGHKMCEFLRPFYSITNLMSGSSYPTSNLYFMQVWKIECLLIENMSNEDEVIRDMSTKMKVKFDKYWSHYSIVLALATVLDPRMKLPFLEFCYSKLGLDPIACQAKVKVVKHKLYTLFNEYMKMSSSHETTTNASETQNLEVAQHIFGVSSEEDQSHWDVLNEYAQYENQNYSDVGKSQLDIYLDEQKLAHQYHKALDLLQYWKENKDRFPDLALMAIDIFSIQITTVASESAFSIGSRVLNKYRSSLLPENVQALICTRNWLLGFDVEGKYDGESLEVETNEVPPSVSKRASNIIVVEDVL